MNINRRQLLIGAAATAAAAAIPASFLRPRYQVVKRPKRSRVAVVPVARYSDNVEEELEYGLRSFPIDVKGKSVVLKPNLVDYNPEGAINTHPSLVVAAANCFRRRGARSRS